MEYYYKNRDKILARNRERRKDPEHKQYHMRKTKEWIKKNREHYYNLQKGYREKKKLEKLKKERPEFTLVAKIIDNEFQQCDLTLRIL